MKRMFPVLIAVFLMIAIAGGAIYVWLKDKYSYGTEVMDLRTYFDVEEGKLAIYLQEERLPEKALLRDGGCYLNLTFVKSYLLDGFYFDRAEKKLLYTDALGSFVAAADEEGYFRYGEKMDFDGKPCFMEGESLFVSLPYVAMLSGVEYQYNAYRLQLITSREPYEAAQVKKDTKIRYRGGIKSEILCDAAEGEMLRVLERMDTWCMVQNEDGITGYVENKFLGDEVTMEPVKQEQEEPYAAPEYVSKRLYEKVCLGWHAIGGVGGNATLEEMVQNSVGMNVIAPTWFSLNDNEGGFRNFGEASYVERAHNYGLVVWGVWDDFNYEGETGENIDDTAIFSSSARREKLIQGIISTAVSLGLDGVNLDFEKVGADCREHYAQFLKELSVECRKKQLTLSVDNYMPNEGNKQYRLDVQGRVADYVILMGYDEHWHGCGNPGSVASIGFVSDGITKALKDVPADKLVNAVPFYTIVWEIDGAEVTDRYLTLVNEPEYIQRIGVEPVWDDVTCQNYMEWSSGGITHKVWLEDLDSISMKLNVMSANEIAGVAAWKLGSGTQDVWTLLAAFKQM